VTAAELRARFADEDFASLLELIDAAAKLAVVRDDFDPPKGPDEDEETDEHVQEWKDHADELFDYADAIDDKLVDAQAAVDHVRQLAEEVRRNFGL
jgi:hypothetical protein